MLALINSIKRFCVYLLGIHFKIITNYKIITLTLQRKDINPHIARWVMFLQNYSYEIEYSPRSLYNMLNQYIVDALSHCKHILACIGG